MRYKKDPLRDEPSPVVIRFSWLERKWYIAFAGSYQNAYRATHNSFDSRTYGELEAMRRGHVVHYHPHDPLQQPSIELE